VELSEVSLHIELIDPFSNESSSNLGPDPPISSLSSPYTILPSSLDFPEPVFIESETFVLDSPYLDKTLDDSDLDRLKPHFEVKDLTLGHPVNFDVHISLDYPCLGPLPSPFRDVVLHFGYSDHYRWLMHSYSHIIIRPLTSASDFAYTHLSSNWAKSFYKLKRALSGIPFLHSVWVTPSPSANAARQMPASSPSTLG